MADSKHLILLGSHAGQIDSVIFDAQSRTLTRGATTSTPPNPTWLTRHPDPAMKSLMYANSNSDGMIHVYRLVDDQGQLVMLAETSTGGDGPAHIAILPDGSGIVIAHYTSGTVTVLPLTPGGLFAAKEPSPDALFRPQYTPRLHHRQESAHVHQIVFNKGEMFVPDLGSNKVWRLVWTGKKLDVVGAIEGLEDGDGPRHCVVHPRGTHLYLLNEISSHITIHTLPSQAPSRLVKRLSLLPPGDNGADRPTGASAIILLPPTVSNGRILLIASNRDSPVSATDTLALFSVSMTDGEDVQRTDRGWYEGLGRHLRGVGADESGTWVAVLGRDSGGVKILERTGLDGLDLKEVASIEVGNTVAPLWID